MKTMPTFIQHKNLRLNKQNLHMALLHEKVHEAMLALMLLNITILRVELGGHCPLIDVMNTVQCHQLDSFTFAICSNGAGRHNTKRALVKGCTVQWQSGYNVH